DETAGRESAVTLEESCSRCPSRGGRYLILRRFMTGDMESVRERAPDKDGGEPGEAISRSQTASGFRKLEPHALSLSLRLSSERAWDEGWALPHQYVGAEACRAWWGSSPAGSPSRGNWDQLPARRWG